MRGPNGEELPGAVLFACTMNSVRSVMAFSIMKYLYGKFVYVDAAGVRAGELDPMAVEVMDEIGIEVGKYRPKRFEDMEDSSMFDLCITLSPEAQHRAIDLAHTSAIDIEYWPTMDPTIVEGSRDQRLDAYRATRDGIMKRIKNRFAEKEGVRHMKLIAFAACLSVLVAIGAAQAATRILFVGCPSDGQNGPLPAPSGRSRAVDIDPRFAARLAFYKSEFNSVIAPRGWHCAGLYGSNGSSLIVMPHPRTAEDLILHRQFIAGPAVQLSTMSGETSGRFEVADIAARYFPKKRTFVNAVIAEKIEPATGFVFAPFPGDRFVHRDGRRVEVATPPHVDGLGTRSRLVADDLSIRSVAIVEGDPPNLVELTVKLPLEARDLLPAIVGQVH